jgi:phosphonate transport system substrate-binding protein
MARIRRTTLSAAAMRDADCDLTSFLVVKSASKIRSIADLKGCKVGFGSIDSPQATLIPLDHMRQAGLLANHDFSAYRFDLLGGKHGDHIGGERDGRQHRRCLDD